MARNYDNYGYDKEYRNRGSLIRRILIVLMIIVAIILIAYLLRGCKKKTNNNGKTTNVDTYNYETELVNAGKEYFDKHQSELPSSPGECSVVELGTLMNEDLINKEKFGECNSTTTYLKVCILENGMKQYSPWLTCVKKSSEKEYTELASGTMSDIIQDKTYVEFKFLPQVSVNEKQILGPVEEMYKEDIKYNAYKTLATTKYYRFRDKLYLWKLINRYYYTTEGIKNNASSVREYYVSAPNSSYTLKSDKTTEAYKWYTSTSKKEYYMKNGSKMPSLTAVGDYTIRDPYGFDATRYRTRTITGTYSPYRYYACSTSSNSEIIKYQQDRCGTGISPEFNYQRDMFYTCETDSSLVRTSTHVSSNATCYRYSDWSALTTTACNTSKPDICQSITLTFYYWYKIVGENKTYYPSGATNASAERVYYTSEPIKGAIKDTTTKATAYKWYDQTTTYSASYTALAPSGYTLTQKTSDSKWSEWSDWSTKNPATKDGRERKIETKTKLKIQEIKGTDPSSWKDLTADYVSEEELIKTFNANGYKVKSLEDIVNNGQIKYLIKVFVRNKKESY